MLCSALAFVVIRCLSLVLPVLSAARVLPEAEELSDSMAGHRLDVSRGLHDVLTQRSHLIANAGEQPLAEGAPVWLHRQPRARHAPHLAPDEYLQADFSRRN